MSYFTDAQLAEDLELTVTQPHPKHIKIVAHIGDLYLGEKLYVGGSVKAAKKNAIAAIKYNGTLNIGG
jgi:hypothetical protein